MDLRVGIVYCVIICHCSKPLDTFNSSQFSLQQNPYPIKCPNGTFNPHEGRKHVSECVKCTEGYYCEPEGLEKEVNYIVVTGDLNFFSRFGEELRFHCIDVLKQITKLLLIT